MKVLIVEDEKVAAQQLKNFIQEYNNSIEILPLIDSCAELEKWLQQKNETDLILCDIELTDGNALNVLKEAEINAAVIFTTAYDNFWIQALKLNGIDYLLKPITKEKVFAALDKAEAIKKIFSKDKNILSQLQSLMNKAPNAFYKKRFPVRVNNEVFVLETDSIILFRIIEGVIFALLEKGKKLPLVEETLNELETKLNPEFFFRINRSEIINARYIESIKIQEGNDYIIQLKEFGEKLSVSSSRINKLKNWLNDPLSISMNKDF